MTLYFAFLPDSPSPTAARTLTLVAKSVQNLANLVEFGAKVNVILHIENHLELCFRTLFTHSCVMHAKNLLLFSHAEPMSFSSSTLTLHLSLVRLVFSVVEHFKALLFILSYCQT